MTKQTTRDVLCSLVRLARIHARNARQYLRAWDRKQLCAWERKQAS